MKKLRELLEEMAHAVDTFKHPNITEAVAEVDKVLVALGAGGIGGDKVSSVDFFGEYVRIETTYTCRGCENTDDFYIPMSIVDSDDPIFYAKKYRVTKLLEDATRKHATAVGALARAKETMEQAANEYNELMKQGK